MSNKTTEAIAAGTRTEVWSPSNASSAAATNHSCMTTMIPINSATDVNSVIAWCRVSKIRLPSNFDSNCIQIVAALLQPDPRQPSGRRAGGRAAFALREAAVVTRAKQLPMLGVVDHCARKMRAHLGVGQEFTGR